MKQKIYNLIILDKSGSMMSLAETAVNSVNETIQTIRSSEQENPEQEQFITMVHFNSQVETLFEMIPAAQVKELGKDDYKPGGLTALYDAIGMSIGALEPKITDEDRVLVTIVTDGMENNSIEYTGPMVKSLIDRLKGKGWVFAYIGANHDVEQAAATISIHNTILFEAKEEGFKEAFLRTDRARKRLYKCMATPGFESLKVNSSFFDESDEEL